jgi:hypothetical protein
VYSDSEEIAAMLIWRQIGGEVANIEIMYRVG